MTFQNLRMTSRTERSREGGSWATNGSGKMIILSLFLFSSTPKNAHFSRFHILFNYLLITLFLKIIYIRSNYFENKMEKKDILPEIDYSASIVIGFGEILIYARTGLISINRGFYIGKFLTPFPTS